MTQVTITARHQTAKQHQTAVHSSALSLCNSHATPLTTRSSTQPTSLVVAQTMRAPTHSQHCRFPLSHSFNFQHPTYLCGNASRASHLFKHAPSCLWCALNEGACQGLVILTLKAASGVFWRVVDLQGGQQQVGGDSARLSGLPAQRSPHACNCRLIFRPPSTQPYPSKPHLYLEDIACCACQLELLITS